MPGYSGALFARDQSCGGYSFYKNGNTLWDGLMIYHMPDGGFVNSFAYDEENPSSEPDKSNSMAGGGRFMP